MASASRETGGTVRVLRVLGLGVLLVGGSFLLGALIVAPLYNAWFGTGHEPAPPAPSAAGPTSQTSLATPPPAPAPAPRMISTTPPPRREEPRPSLSVEPDIQITPDDGGSVQAPQSLDSANESRTDGASADAAAPDQPERVRRSTPAQDETPRERPRRSRRARRHRPAADAQPSAAPPPAPASPAEPPVQQGESLP